MNALGLTVSQTCAFFASTFGYLLIAWLCAEILVFADWNHEL